MEGSIDVEAGTYTYRVVAVYELGDSKPAIIENVVVNPVTENDLTLQPAITRLLSNYPNPFNPETVIRFALASDAFVSIEIYNIRGQRVRSLVAEERRAGEYNVMWNGRDDNGNSVAAGIYFYRMRAGEYQSIRRMLMIK